MASWSGACLAVTCAPQPVWGVPDLTVGLDYRVAPDAEGCPSDIAFARAVADQLGYDPFRPDAGRRIVAQVRPNGGGLEGRVTWLGVDGQKEGERYLLSQDRNCGAIVKGMTFAIAVQLQFLRLSGAVPPTTPPPPAAVDAEPTPAPPLPILLALGLGPTASIGSAPSVTAGARLRFALQQGAASLELSGQANVPVSLRRPDGSGFSAYLLGLGLAPCGQWKGLALCGLAAIEQLRVEGRGLDDIRSPSSFMTKGGLRIGVHQALSGRFEVALHVDGLYTLTPRTVTLSTSPVWTTPPLTVTVGLDISAIHAFK